MTHYDTGIEERAQPEDMNGGTGSEIAQREQEEAEGSGRRGRTEARTQRKSGRQRRTPARFRDFVSY